MDSCSGVAWLGVLATCFVLGCSGAGPEPIAPASGTPSPDAPLPPPAESPGVGTAEGDAAADPSGPSGAAARVDAGPASPLSAAAEPPAPPEADTSASPALRTFHAALGELECGKRKDHVRVVWLGDSHAQADFWTGAVRSALQERFGSGGPGFVRVGYRDYRHSSARLGVQGKWRNRPKQPATTERYADGALGLGGILTAGYADRPSASVELTDARLQDRPIRWDLCYKLTEAGASFRVEAAGAKPREVKADGNESVNHLVMEGTWPATLRVIPGAGRPEMCGVVVESDPAAGPGVVLDNLGINGARYATALAWDAGAWAMELGRRSPELVVIEYGGNEAGDYVSRPEAYGRHLTTLVERIRRVRPDVSCVVVGLAEREDREKHIVAIRDAQRDGAERAGCMFWDTFEVMGGPGSMRAWKAQKKAGPDGIHLMPKGYAELAAHFTQSLLRGYRRPCTTTRGGEATAP